MHIYTLLETGKETWDCWVIACSHSLICIARPAIYNGHICHFTRTQTPAHSFWHCTHRVKNRWVSAECQASAAAAAVTHARSEWFFSSQFSMLGATKQHFAFNRFCHSVQVGRVGAAAAAMYVLPSVHRVFVCVCVCMSAISRWMC